MSGLALHPTSGSPNAGPPRSWFGSPGSWLVLAGLALLLAGGIWLGQRLQSWLAQRSREVEQPTSTAQGPPLITHRILRGLVLDAQGWPLPSAVIRAFPHRADAGQAEPPEAIGLSILTAQPPIPASPAGPGISDRVLAAMPTPPGPSAPDPGRPFFLPLSPRPSPEAWGPYADSGASHPPYWPPAGAADDLLWSVAPYAIARTGIVGMFQLALPHGRYDLLISSPGHAHQLVRDRLAGDPLPPIALTPGLAISGQLKGFSASAVVEAEPLSAAHTIPQAIHPTTDGRFRFTGLKPGAYALTATDPSGDQDRQLPITAGTSGITLSLLPRRRLTGEVLSTRDAAPVAGVRVTLIGSGVWPARSVLTDRQGRYEFLAVPAGWYVLRAVREPDLASGFLEGVHVGARTEETTQALIIERQPVVTLEVLRADNGAPVGEAELTLAPYLPATLALRGQTDPQGRWRLGPLAPGRYQASVRAPGLVSIQEQPLEVGWADLAGPHQTLRITLFAEAALSGQILDAIGEPLAQAEVEAVSHERGTCGPLAWSNDSTTRSRIRRLLGGQVTTEQRHTGVADRTGHFRLAGLGPGTWSLLARHRNHAASSVGPFTLNPGQVREAIELRLLPTGSLTGRVVNADHDPVVFARVRFEGQAGTVTDLQGAFTLLGLRGDGSLLVEAAGFADHQQRLRIDPLEASQPQLIVLQPQRAGLRGFVLGPQGEEVDGASVIVQGTGGLTRQTTTRASGDFEIPDPPPPPWTIEVRAPGAARWQRTIPQLEGPLEVELQAGGTLRLEVLAEGSYEPLRQAGINLQGPQTLRWKGKLNNGFLAIDQLVPGSYAVEVAAAGYLPQLRTGLLVEERRDPDPIRILLSRGGSLGGRVTDLEGAPLGQVRVTAHPRSPRLDFAQLTASTDATGAFRLNPLPEGDLTLSFEAAGYEVDHRNERVVAGDEYNDLEIKLKPKSW